MDIHVQNLSLFGDKCSEFKSKDFKVPNIFTQGIGISAIHKSTVLHFPFSLKQKYLNYYLIKKFWFVCFLEQDRYQQLIFTTV